MKRLRLLASVALTVLCGHAWEHSMGVPGYGVENKGSVTVQVDAKPVKAGTISFSIQTNYKF